jgi:hypothetical protein
MTKNDKKYIYHSHLKRCCISLKTHHIEKVIKKYFYLFPFRTEKLSLVTPMVLRNSGRVGSRRFFKSPLRLAPKGTFLYLLIILESYSKFNTKQ